LEGDRVKEQAQEGDSGTLRNGNLERNHGGPGENVWGGGPLEEKRATDKEVLKKKVGG